MDKTTFHAGKPVRTSGIYASAGGRRVALSEGEMFPETTKGTGWTLEERISVERSPEIQARGNRPVIMEPEALEYAIETSWSRGWAGSLRALEVKILAAEGKMTRARVLLLLAEVRRSQAKIDGEAEGDLSHG